MNKILKFVKDNKGYFLASAFVIFAHPLIYLMQNKHSIPFNDFLVSIPVIFTSMFILSIPIHYLLNSKDIKLRTAPFK